MGERKVLNKFIPPDFDPTLVPRSKQKKKDVGMVSVRMMLPFTLQCSTCSTFLYRGRKFNSKKEAMQGPNGKYLGIQRFRFYIKCTACSRPLTFLTDPENADYEMESGGTRTYEVHKDKRKTEDEAALEREEEEKEDKMKALENRVLESQRELEDMDNLEQIREMNMRHVQLLSKSKNSSSFGDEARAVLLAREGSKSVEDEELNENGLTKEDEALVRSIKFGDKIPPNEGTRVIHRLDEEDEKRLEEKRKDKAKALAFQQKQVADRSREKSAKNQSKPMVPLIKVKRKKVTKESESKRQKVDSNSNDAPSALGGLLGGYGSDSDSN